MLWQFCPMPRATAAYGESPHQPTARWRTTPPEVSTLRLGGDLALPNGQLHMPYITGMPKEMSAPPPTRHGTPTQERARSTALAPRCAISQHSLGQSVGSPFPGISPDPGVPEAPRRIGPSVPEASPWPYYLADLSGHVRIEP